MDNFVCYVNLGLRGQSRIHVKEFPRKERHAFLSMVFVFSKIIDVNGQNDHKSW